MVPLGERYICQLYNEKYFSNISSLKLVFPTRACCAVTPTHLQVCHKTVQYSEHNVQRSAYQEACVAIRLLSQNRIIYLVPLRKDNVIAFLLQSAGKFESCFEKWLFIKMKMLTVFVGQLTRNYFCLYRATVAWKTPNPCICYLKCILQFVLGLGS